MNLSRIILRALALCVLASAQSWAQGVPAAAPQKKQMCEGCHGIPDYRTAYPQVYRVPKLGGQTPAYLVKALQDYKSGARNHPTMRGIAADLTEQEMAALAAYYAGSSAPK